MNKVILGLVVAALSVPLVTLANTGTGSTATGTTQTGVVRPPMGSGAQMAQELKGLHLAIGQLSPANRATLVKMIRDYLVSKGVDPAKYADMRDDIHEMRKEMHEGAKEMRKDMRDEMKDMRQGTREEIQKKRDEMKAKIRDVRNAGWDAKTNTK